jgi:hypothetical protein
MSAWVAVAVAGFIVAVCVLGFVLDVLEIVS